MYWSSVNGTSRFAHQGLFERTRFIRRAAPPLVPASPILDQREMLGPILATIPNLRPNEALPQTDELQTRLTDNLEALGVQVFSGIPNGRTGGGFSEAWLRCPMASRKDPRWLSPRGGLMHLWRTVDLVIPCRVASPQSPTPFHQAMPGLLRRDHPASRHRTAEPCRRKSSNVDFQLREQHELPMRFGEMP